MIWLGNVNSTYGQSERDQWLAAAEAIHVAMLVSFLCGYFLSVKKCDLRPTRIQRYLGKLCDSETGTLRVPADKLWDLQYLLRTVLEVRRLSFWTLERIAGEWMSLTVDIHARLSCRLTPCLRCCRNSRRRERAEPIWRAIPIRYSWVSFSSGFVLRPLLTRDRGNGHGISQPPSTVGRRTHRSSGGEGWSTQARVCFGWGAYSHSTGYLDIPIARRCTRCKMYCDSFVRDSRTLCGGR